MKQLRIFLPLAGIIFAVAVLVQGTRSEATANARQAQGAQQAPPTIASTVDREVTTIEKLIVDAAEAMPEDKFNFTPESLNIPGSEYKGVRSAV
jgi:hypothetical protein